MNAPIHAALLAARSAHAEALTDTSKQKFLAARAAISAGDELAIRAAGNALLADLTCTPQYDALVRTALTCGAEVTGREFTRLLVEAMQASALQQTKREIRAANWEAPNNPEADRPRTHAQALLLEKLQE